MLRIAERNQISMSARGCSDDSPYADAYSVLNVDIYCCVPRHRCRKLNVIQCQWLPVSVLHTASNLNFGLNHSNYYISAICTPDLARSVCKSLLRSATTQGLTDRWQTCRTTLCYQRTEVLVAWTRRLCGCWQTVPPQPPR